MRVTQVVMGQQIVNQTGALGLPRPHQTHRERLQLRQQLGDRLGRSCRRSFRPARRPTTATVLARGQLQIATVLQPVEQQADGHVAQLPLAISPIPEFGQRHRQGPAAPAGPLVDPALELAQILRREPAAENADRTNHAPELAGRRYWKPVLSLAYSETLRAVLKSAKQILPRRGNPRKSLVPSEPTFFRLPCHLQPTALEKALD